MAVCSVCKEVITKAQIAYKDKDEIICHYCAEDILTSNEYAKFGAESEIEILLDTQEKLW